MNNVKHRVTESLDYCYSIYGIHTSDERFSICMSDQNLSSSSSWFAENCSSSLFSIYSYVSAVCHTMYFVFQDVQIDVCAILNDTTGTLMSCAWKNFNCRIGLIVGMWKVGKFELLFAWCTSTVCCCMHLLVLRIYNSALHFTAY